MHLNGFDDKQNIERSWLTNGTVDPLHYFNIFGNPVLDQSQGPYLPTWQTSPLLQSNVVNEDVFFEPNVAPEAMACIDSEAAVLGRFITGPPGSNSNSDRTTAFLATLQSISKGAKVDYLGDPMAYLYLPVFDSFNETKRKLVAVIISVIHWQSYFTKLLPSNIEGITVVLESTCDGFFTYEIGGEEANVVGFGDRHDPTFDSLQRTAKFELDRLEDGTIDGIKFNQEYICSYELHIYSSREPAQVFILLQTVYQQFDVLAKRRKVFKVETIGDSYLAVTGLPEAQPNHAVIMARFAWEARNSVRDITRDLESTLGPGTGK